MRITEAQLRSLIREELERSIDEMAWGGHIGLQRSGKPLDQFDAGGAGLYDPNPKAATKYAMSDAFKKKAQQLYANFPFRIFTAPFIGNINDPEITSIPGAGRGRRSVIPLSRDVLSILRDQLMYKIPKKLEPTDLIILYTSAGAKGKQTAPSPWNIFHAIFNGEMFDKELDSISPTFRSLLERDMMRDPADPLLPIMGDVVDVSTYMTMGSARDNMLGEFIESVAEAVVQELIDRRRLHFNAAAAEAPPEVQAALREFKRLITICAEEARENMQGKLIVVDVS